MYWPPAASKANTESAPVTNAGVVPLGLPIICQVPADAGTVTAESLPAGSVIVVSVEKYAQ